MEVYTPATIASKLSSKEVQNDVEQCKKFLAKAMLLTGDQDVDLNPLISPMINLLAHSDLGIKKIACHFIAQVSHSQTDLMLLAVNTLLKDCEDSNPMVRRLAMKAICTVQLESFAEHRQRVLLKGLNDGSGYVRRSAVMSCLTLNESSSERSTTVLEHAGIVDKLYSMIRDTDPIVAVNCVAVLEEILKGEGGIVVSRSMTNYLLNKLSTFTPSGVANVLNVLKKYQPRNEEEIFDIMNLVDAYLQNNSCSVVINAADFFLSMTKHMPHMTTEIYKRAYRSLLNILSSGNVEIIAELLNYFESHIDELKPVLQSNCKMFYCRVKDPSYLKQRKLKLLVGLVSETNVSEIYDEVSMLCSDGDHNVSYCAINTLPLIMSGFPKMASVCSQKIIELLDSHKKHVVSNILQVLVTMENQELSGMESVIDKLFKICQYVTDSEGKCAVLNLIGQYGGTLQDSTYILEDFVENFPNENSILVKSQLLLTSVRLFCQKPAESQGILGNLLELCMDDDCHNLQDQARFYYSLMETDINLLKTIFEKL